MLKKKISLYQQRKNIISAATFKKMYNGVVVLFSIYMTSFKRRKEGDSGHCLILFTLNQKEAAVEPFSTGHRLVSA